MTRGTAEDKAQAAAFAKRWYSRPASGCDEATLANLLEEEIATARHRGKAEEAALVIASLAKACGFSVTIGSVTT